MQKNYIKDVHNKLCETSISQSKKKETLVGEIELFIKKITI